MIGLLSGEAVDAAEAGEGWGCFTEALIEHLGGWLVPRARFQMRPDDDDDDDDAPSSACGASFFGEACGVLLGKGDFPCRDFLEGWGLGQGSGLGGVPWEVGSHHPLVRQHAVPGGMWEIGERLSRRAAENHMAALMEW